MVHLLKINAVKKALAFVLASCFLLTATSLHSEEVTRLTLGVNSPGTPPHLYFDKVANKYAGVIPDLLEYVAQHSNLTIEFVHSHRNRNERFVASGRFDMFYSSLAWVQEANAFISTIPIFEHKSYLYASRPFPVGFKLNGNKRVCARRGFIYPVLDPLFAEGKLTRVDSESHDTMLSMLLLGRCDMVEMDYENANALLASNKFKDARFYRYEKVISTVPEALLLYPERTAERDILNTLITQFKNEGHYAKSIAKHANKSS